MKVYAYLGLGSNLGDRRKNIAQAIGFLKASNKLSVEKISRLIETIPQDGPPQGKFLNGAIKISTSLSAFNLLCFLQDVENKLGRARGVKNGPRTIDLDILLYDDKDIDKEGLRIPHPRMLEREFVLKPLLEIEPDIFDTHKLLKPYKNKVRRLIEDNLSF
ncbi:MAG: 2-amino-4-hydroxy-6-hydroxymethyldihydropteridine diphosphokinase [Candidatus Omnitrophica bacterium]|nr:2-amino-4-hydroxy-6-hydroxymethyldihydropteridine diphosphokinase [Candidatus Omnitrophota bacterium]